MTWYQLVSLPYRSMSGLSLSRNQPCSNFETLAIRFALSGVLDINIALFFDSAPEFLPELCILGFNFEKLNREVVLSLAIHLKAQCYAVSLLLLNIHILEIINLKRIFFLLLSAAN
ncbi:unnamed protein product [Rhizophagus irregularis]|nr:unnamed protein product [Rhizophagus irregularis]